MAKREGQLIDEEKEKAAIEWENKVLFILMPLVGLIAVALGVTGFILTMSSNSEYKIPVSVFLIVLAVLGLGGIAYGVVQFIKRRRSKAKKERKEPSAE